MRLTMASVGGTLDGYLGRYPAEAAGLRPLLALLADGADVRSRREFRGHVTAGAALIGPGRRIVQIHHRASGKWLIPGGHLDTEDESLLAAARRELAEETGIPAAAVTSLAADPIRISAHAIPARVAKGEPEHRHFDFKFCFRTAAEIGQVQAEEVAGARWVEIGQLRDPLLVERISAIVGEVWSAP